jgi:hypothetical protein
MQVFVRFGALLVSGRPSDFLVRGNRGWTCYTSLVEFLAVPARMGGRQIKKAGALWENSAHFTG